jgi:hypothetical protein
MAASIFNMPKGDAEFFQALICQVRQDRGVDVVLGKALRVLGHAELFEPMRKVLHCAAPGRSGLSTQLCNEQDITGALMMKTEL